MLTTSLDTEMVACIDDDQVDLYPARDRPRFKYHVGPRTDIVGSLNAAVKAHPDYDAYGLIVDDAMFKTVGWDQWMIGRMGSLKNGIGVISAAHSVGAFVNFAYVSRAWVRALGWYACPDTLHFCWDTVMELLGEATEIVYATRKEFFIEHELVQSDRTVPIFMMDAVQFLGWCVNARRKSVYNLREVMNG
jgi:hypothetical protein